MEFYGNVQANLPGCPLNEIINYLGGHQNVAEVSEIISNYLLPLRTYGILQQFFHLQSYSLSFQNLHSNNSCIRSGYDKILGPNILCMIVNKLIAKLFFTRKHNN